MPKQIVILYVMDALRADHLGCYGYDRPTSEFIDSLAKESILYKKVHSQSTETKSSAATLLTSVYPSVHGTYSYSAVLPQGLVTLPELFQANGYTTAAFNTNFRISSEYGFNRGFDHFFDLHGGGQFDDTINLPTSIYLNQEVLSWLDQCEADNVFLLIWSMDTHIPYKPPLSEASRFIPDIEQVPDGTAEAIFRAEKPEDFQRLVALYNAEIARNDSSIELLAEALEERNLWEQATFILTADHGEMFLEHGHFMIHGGIPYTEVTHVPLLIKSPELIPTEDNTPGGLIDIMPTILSLSKIAVPEQIQGRDLLKKNPPDHILTESFQENGGHSFAISDGIWKLIQSDGTLRYQVWGRIINKLFHRKKAKEMAHFKQKVLNTGIDPTLIKRALFKRLKSDFYGNPPIFSAKIGWLRWLKCIITYFLGTNRLELYNTESDPSERINLTAFFDKEVKHLQKILTALQDQNHTFKQQLSLTQYQLNSEDEELMERLRALGYIE